MRSERRTAFLLSCLLVLAACFGDGTREYPETRRGDDVTELHGTSVPDPYRWLEDREDPAVAEWSRNQHDLTMRTLAGTGLIDEVRASLARHYRKPSRTAPTIRGDRWYWRENPGNLDQSRFVSGRGYDGDVSVVIDPATLSEDGRTTLKFTSIDPTGRWLAYGISDEGNDWTRIRIRDLSTGIDLSREIVNVKFSRPRWLSDGSGFYYDTYKRDASFGKKLGGNSIRFHKMGQPVSADSVIYKHPDDSKHFASISPTHDRRFLVYRFSQGKKSRLEIADMAPGAERRELVGQDFESRWNYVTNDGTLFYFQTNEQAPRSRLVSLKLPAAGEAPRPTTDILPEGPGVLRSVRSLGDYFVVQRLRDNVDSLALHDRRGRHVRDIELPGSGVLKSVRVNQDQREIWFGYESYISPTALYRVRGPEWKPEKMWEATSDHFDPDDYETYTVSFQSKDGTEIPMTIAHRKGLKKDGSNPTLLYGYGGFNIAVRPGFAGWAAHWMSRGGVIAQANLRGGSEFGETWHEAGMLTRKQNVFDDFIGAGEWLVTQKITSPKHLGIWGRSNGGLLTAACVVQRPDLFGAVLSGMPVIDMMRYHKFTIGHAWVPEYGDPEESEEIFRALLAYSPLHNVKQDVKYPPILVYSAWSDDRVVPAHAMKFVAELQYKDPKGGPHLLRMEPKSGHGGAGSIDKTIIEFGDLFAFLEWRLFN